MYLFRISEDDIIKLDDRDQTHVLCTGEAGAGKSTLSKRMVSLWARGKMTSPFWNKIKTVIYLTPTDEEDNLTQTMRNAIPGKKAYKDLIMDLFNDEPESVLVIVEGFNEFQNARVIKEIMRLLNDQATNVFLTARRDSERLTSSFRGLFYQSVEVNGFSDTNSNIHAQKLLEQLKPAKKTPESYHNTGSEQIPDFLKAIKDKPKVWKSPLNLSLACLLYREGYLNPSDIAQLTEVSLYDMRENRMVEREFKEDESGVRLIVETELNKIHKLAVYLLVKNRAMCTLDDLRFFKIDVHSPVLVLLDKKENFTIRNGLSTSWTWPHSQLREFDAARGATSIKDFKDSQWMYWMASRTSFNPIVKFVSVILGDDQRHSDLKALTTVTILLQNTTECSKSCDSLQTENRQCAWLDDYREKGDHEKDFHLSFSEGEFVIQDRALELPDISLLCECRGSLFNENITLFKHVQECWKLGKLNEKEMDYVVYLEDILLPALDRLVRSLSLQKL